jgi:hypothetical protein
MSVVVAFPLSCIIQETNASHQQRPLRMIISPPIKLFIIHCYPGDHDPADVVLLNVQMGINTKS